MPSSAPRGRQGRGPGRWVPRLGERCPWVRLAWQWLAAVVVRGQGQRSPLRLCFISHSRGCAPLMNPR